MPLVTKTSTECDCQKLCLKLLGLNILQIFVAIVCFGVGAYISLNVDSKAHLLHNYSLKSIGGTLSGCSIFLFFLHCLGATIVVRNDCQDSATRKLPERFLFLVVLLYIAMLLGLLAVPVMCLVKTYKTEEALSHGLSGPMKLYSRSRNLKNDIDQIQMEYKCCGSSNYTDWFHVKWLPKNSIPPKHLPENSDIFETLGIILGYFNSRKSYSVPFSCCNPSFSGPCSHTLGQFDGTIDYGFHHRGCIEALREVLQEVLHSTIALMLLPFFLELTIVVYTRYLQISLDSCKRRGNLTEEGAGQTEPAQSSNREEGSTTLEPSLDEESNLNLEGMAGTSWELDMPSLGKQTKDSKTMYLELNIHASGSGYRRFIDLEQQALVEKSKPVHCDLIKQKRVIKTDMEASTMHEREPLISNAQRKASLKKIQEENSNIIASQNKNEERDVLQSNNDRENETVPKVRRNSKIPKRIREQNNKATEGNESKYARGNRSKIPMPKGQVRDQNG